jgi:hypothetical protein
MDELLEKLQSELEIASWDLIDPHYKRDVVVFVKLPNDLVQTALLFADNKSHLVKGLMDAGELYKPSAEEVAQWMKDHSQRFKFLIVRPFVLIQPVVKS